ncbi:MAG: pentapeptide repeat-containing protein [Acidimicrobiales bacterium]|nr:pentapeptide repeat-containing protein [Acidimicrobiales bacterium]
MDEPYADPPRSTGPLTTPGEDAVVDIDDRWGSIEDADLAGPLDIAACDRLEIRGSSLAGVSFTGGGDVEIEAVDCAFTDCDLSGLRFTQLQTSSFVGCKLSGVDLTSALLRDVRIERTVLRLTSIRMAEMERVAFVDSTLEEIDCYETRFAHVDVTGSALREVELDKATFFRVDLRGALELDLRKCRRFDGCLITDDQVLALAYVLAGATGISIDRSALETDDD